MIKFPLWLNTVTDDMEDKDIDKFLSLCTHNFPKAIFYIGMLHKVQLEGQKTDKKPPNRNVEAVALRDGVPPPGPPLTLRAVEQLTRFIFIPAKDLAAAGASSAPPTRQSHLKENTVGSIPNGGYRCAYQQSGCKVMVVMDGKCCAVRVGVRKSTLRVAIVMEGHFPPKICCNPDAAELTRY
uniref:Uncharacterized protein n=1 Tax=Timema cristinae TaxID=61476 RepID=A0A7R9H9R1_TIMCR|nr:unnamed protein product [Timema cristinae]